MTAWDHGYCKAAADMLTHFGGSHNNREEVWSYRDRLVFLQRSSDVHDLKRRWLLCRHRNRGLLFAVLKVRFKMICRILAMPLLSWTKFDLVYFRTLNCKQVTGKILHATQLKTLPWSRCFANVQALGHNFNLSPNTPLILSLRLIETLPSSPFPALIWIAKPTSRWYMVCLGQGNSDSKVHFWKLRRKQKGDKPLAYSGAVLIEPSCLMAKLNPNMTHVSVFMLDKLFLYCWVGIIRLS